MTVISASSAAASTIIGATSVTSTNTNTAAGASVDNLINQSGLGNSVVGFPYESGVTDFEAYIAEDPMHFWGFSGNEWATEPGVVEATLIFDLGNLFLIDGLILWNEESAGVGTATLSASTDGTSFSEVAAIEPTDHPLFADYPADVIRFDPVSAQFLQLELTQCPQSGGQAICALGEVAFIGEAASTVTPVPLPASGLLLGATAFGLVIHRRRHTA